VSAITAAAAAIARTAGRFRFIYRFPRFDTLRLRPCPMALARFFNGAEIREGEAMTDTGGSAGVPMDDFYGPELARIHHARFGDLGCGSGILAGLVQDAGYQVLGIDISAEMIEIARRQAPGADLRVGSLYDVELPAGCVAVTAIGECVN
jgi:SAM-dependent methyltransferase